MKLRWTGRALSDLLRLEEFLQPKSERAAARVVQMLVAAPHRLVDHPRIGELVEHSGTEEVRCLFVGDYEIRYEVRPDEIWVARIWHTREDR